MFYQLPQQAAMQICLVNNIRTINKIIGSLPSVSKYVMIDRTKGRKPCSKDRICFWNTKTAADKSRCLFGRRNLDLQDLGRTASRRPEAVMTGRSAVCFKVHPHTSCAFRRLCRRMVPLRRLRYPDMCCLFLL